ncbi:MAG: hypothetical protein LUH15_02970, partial [Tannerellaceae bacterium]|nr:hypothetical protein [Tannerellaceae bacterium]
MEPCLGSRSGKYHPRKLMGVEPLQPGFEKVRIKPQLATLAWVKATIPTIKGEIQMEVENQNSKYCMQVTIPANMEADVYLPLPAKKIQHTNQRPGTESNPRKRSSFSFPRNPAFRYVYNRNDISVNIIKTKSYIVFLLFKLRENRLFRSLVKT